MTDTTKPGTQQTPESPKTPEHATIMRVPTPRQPRPHAQAESRDQQDPQSPVTPTGPCHDPQLDRPPTSPDSPATPVGAPRGTIIIRRRMKTPAPEGRERRALPIRFSDMLSRLGLRSDGKPVKRPVRRPVRRQLDLNTKEADDTATPPPARRSRVR